MTTPDVPGATTFDLLKVVKEANTSQQQAPIPGTTGNYAVVTGVTRASACGNGVCTFIDTQAALSSYKVPFTLYYPFVPYWPGGLALFSQEDSNSSLTASTVTLNTNGVLAGYYQANVLGYLRPAAESLNCNIFLGSPIWQNCLGGGYPPIVDYVQHATLLVNKYGADGGQFTNMKGRLNFGMNGSGPGHIITLSDSAWAKTIASAHGRPPNDANDAYIGQDTVLGLTKFGLSLGAPASISEYVGNAGDGTSWKERLTSLEKTFAVPVVVKDGSTLTVGNGTAISQMKIFHTAAIAPSRVPAQSCVDVKGTAVGLGAGDQVTGITPPKPLGNLALNAYASGTNTVVLHFCNTSPAAESVPTGAHTFLGVR